MSTTRKAIVTEYQPSITEWFAAIGEVQESEEFRNEDSKKDERLTLLHRMMNLPYRMPVVFEARDVREQSETFQHYVREQGDMPCAYRLVPKNPALPKLRHRGYTVRDCYEQWFAKLTIDFENYVVHIFPNETEIDWSLFFVIKEDAVFGEIVRGIPSQLSQGETIQTPVRFSYDFAQWQWSASNFAEEQVVQRALNFLRVDTPEKRTEIQQKVGASFSQEYVQGYFESFVLPDGNLYFMDYNRVLPRYMSAPAIVLEAKTDITSLHGSPVYPGIAQGRVRIITNENVTSAVFEKGDILVTDNTDVRFLPFMKAAGAIVTDRGGILSHASIIARELKTPCIVGAGTATAILHDGDLVEVDANAGTIKILNKN